MKWMAYKDPTTGELTNIRRYAPSEQEASNLIEVTGPPSIAPSAGQRLKDDGNSPAGVVEASSLITLKVSGSAVSSISISPNNLDSVVVTIEGPNNAVIDITWPGLLPISAAQITLDGTGTGSITFGPTNLRGLRPTIVRFEAQGSVNKPVTLDVTFG